MYAFTALEALTATVPSAQLVFDPTPAAYVLLVGLAAAVGSVLGLAMRSRRVEIQRTPRIATVVPRTA